MPKKYTKNVLVIVALLLEFSFTILAGFILGNWLDNLKGSGKRYTIILVILAGIVSVKIFFMIYARAKKIMNSGENGSDT